MVVLTDTVNWTEMEMRAEKIRAKKLKNAAGRPPPHQPQQRLHVPGIDPPVAPHQPLVLGELNLHGAREAQALDQQLLGEFGESVLDGRIEVAYCFQDGERDDAVHHGSRT